MAPNTPSHAPIIETLESFFADANEHFYDKKLVKPVITAFPTGRGNVLGWVTSWKAWQEDGGGGYYELNVCSDHLNRPFENIYKTLLHEMAHLYNLQNGVKDYSRSGYYHNKNFKEAAEAHGLDCERDKTRGWTITLLSTEAAAWLRETYGTCPSAFTLTRGRPSDSDLEDDASSNTPSSAPGTSNSRKYVCPCGTIIRATKVVRVTCDDCGKPFQFQG